MLIIAQKNEFYFKLKDEVNNQEETNVFTFPHYLIPIRKETQLVNKNEIWDESESENKNENENEEDGNLEIMSPRISQPSTRLWEFIIYEVNILLRILYHMRMLQRNIEHT
jgi:uncharacterized protein YfeS